MASLNELEALFGLQGETLATELKAWLDLSTPEGKANLAKAAIALANHGGGTIVMGLRESSTGPLISEPLPSNIPRYNVDDVNAAINRYADPSVHCDVVHLLHPTSRHEHAFVVVPGGHRTPIMSVRDLPGKIASQVAYIRKAGPKSEPPYTSEEWRVLITRCVQNEREALLDSIRIILQGQSLERAETEEVDKLEAFQKSSRARWKKMLESVPSDSPVRFQHGSYEQVYKVLDVAPTPDLREVKNRLSKASEIKMTGWGPFVFFTRPPIGPIPAGDAIEAWLGYAENGVSDPRHADFWRVSRDGFLYEIRGFDEDFTEKAKPGTVLDLTTPIWRIGETILYVARYAELFADDPEIAMQIEYRGLAGRELRSIFDQRYLSYDRRCVIDSLVIRGQQRASVITDNTVEVLMALLSPLYEAFDFAPLTTDMISRELAKFRNSRF